MIIDLINILLVVVSLIVVLPSLVLFVETMAACFKHEHGSSQAQEAEYGSVTILVPAHNEALGIGPTLELISMQLRNFDRLIVIADNCTDDTALIAASHGAEVIQRTDDLLRGKGYALASGVDFLKLNPPDFVIIVDADCSISPSFISSLATTCKVSNRPIQALNLMKSPEGEEQRFAIAEFAWIVRNKVRPLGLSALGFPCQLQGTGMAFPWSIIQSTELASSNVVEDLELGLNLARSGYPARFYTGAKVESLFPVTEEGIIKQRQRWEKGALVMLLSNGPRTLFEAVIKFNRPLLVLALDLMVPPLVVHAAILIVTAAIVSACYMTGVSSLLAVELVILSTFMFATSIVLAWVKFGRDTMPMGMWLRLAPYLFSKLKIYRGFGKRKPQEWTRTDRGKQK